MIACLRERRGVGDGGGGGGGVLRGLRTLSLLFLVTDSSGFSLGVADFTEVESDGAGAEGVGFRLAAVFFEGGTEAADESVEAAPGLAERAGAWGRGIRVAEERAELGVDFGLTELVKVTEEFKDVGPTASVQ